MAAHRERTPATPPETQTPGKLHAILTTYAGRIDVFAVPDGMAKGAPYSWTASVVAYSDPELGRVIQIGGVLARPGLPPITKDEYRAIRECLEGHGYDVALIERWGDKRHWFRQHLRTK